MSNENFDRSILPDLKWYEVLAIVIYLIGDPKNNYCVHLNRIYNHPIILDYLPYKDNKTHDATIRENLQSHNEHPELITDKLEPYYFIYCGDGHYGLSEEGLNYARNVLNTS